MEENGIILGLFPGREYTTVTCSFHDADRCLLYTDGVIEAPNQAGEEFGVERLQDFLSSHASLPAAAFCGELAAQIARWCEKKNGADLHDDMTIVVIDCSASPGRSRDRERQGDVGTVGAGISV